MALQTMIVPVANIMVSVLSEEPERCALYLKRMGIYFCDGDTTIPKALSSSIVHANTWALQGLLGNGPHVAQCANICTASSYAVPSQPTGVLV